MTEEIQKSDEPNLRDCVLMNTVMAARAMTRRYDERLKPFGISVSQFTVMATVRNSPDSRVAHMAARIAMDRTTLIRNLELLERKRLIVSQPAETGNGRLFSLSPRGRALLDEVIPHWSRAQAEIREILSGMSPDDLIGALRALTKG